MDQCLLPMKYPKIFLISSKLITTKPPLFSSDMLNHPCLQFLELHKSQKRAGGAVRGVTACSPGNELQLPQLPRGESQRAPRSPSSLPSGPAPSAHPHSLCPSQLFSPTYPPLFSRSCFDPLWAWVFPTAQVSQSLSLKAFPACPSMSTSSLQLDEGVASCTQVCVTAGEKEETERLVWSIWKFVGFFF